MDYDGFLNLVKSRRSIRRFLRDPVPDESVDKIIEAARWAPSGFNLQPWEFVVVKNKSVKDEIVEICNRSAADSSDMEKTREKWQRGATVPPHAPGVPASDVQAAAPGLPSEQRPGQLPNQPPERPTGQAPGHPPGGDYSSAPVFILCCGDTRTNLGLPMARRYSVPLREEAFKGGLASAFLYMHLAATTLGLASRWVSAVCGPYAQCMIKDLLGIPLDIEIYDMMALGYGAMKPGERIVREKDEMIHYDRSPGSYRTDGEVRSFIRKIRTNR